MLVVSNLFPPHYLGGYELACADVAASLRRRGHEVRVVCGMHGVDKAGESDGAFRALDWRRDPLHPPATSLVRQYRNIRVLAGEIRRFRPDLVHVFNFSGLGILALSWLHRHSGVPVVHDISDLWLPTSAVGLDSGREWLACPSSTPVWGALKRRLFRAWIDLGLDFRRSYFRSRFLNIQHARGGLCPGDLPFIHHGIPFHEIPRRVANASGIVFCGRLDRDKGVDVLVRACARIAAAGRTVRLTLLGGGDEAYVESLRSLVAEAPESLVVEFAGRVPREEALRRVAEHAVYAFPVIWDEPFSIGLVEAMAAGMPIVSTLTGGSPEILQDGNNCLVARVGDDSSLAEGLSKLLDDPALATRLGAEARNSVEHLDFERTVDRVETHLLRQAELR